MSTDHLADAPGRLAEHAGHFGILLARWEQRGTAVDAAAAVRAGHEAIGALDAMLRTLYTARGRLLRELHQDENETAARVDATLATQRAERAYAHTREAEGGEHP